jgi:AcrR family transcriptional regulator
MASPVSDCEVRDPRIRRTRRLLQRALQELLLKRSLDDILVQDITDAATVNRGTFYDHYTDKYALFDAMVAGDFHALLQERKIGFDGTCPGGLTAIVLAVCDYLSLPHLHAGGKNTQGAFTPLMESAITSSIRRVLAGGMPRPAKSTRGKAVQAKSARDQSVLPAEIVANMASWAIYGAVKEWFSTPGHPPAEQIAPLIVKVVHPILRASSSFSDGREPEIVRR